MLTNFGFLDLSTPDLIIILVIILLLFGGKKLPELSKSLGESMKELRKGLNSEAGNDKSKAKTSTKDEEIS
jgi:sec-independent protein translocase protein TatA